MKNKILMGYDLSNKMCTYSLGYIGFKNKKIVRSLGNLLLFICYVFIVAII